MSGITPKSFEPFPPKLQKKAEAAMAVLIRISESHGIEDFVIQVPGFSMHVLIKRKRL